MVRPTKCRMVNAKPGVTYFKPRAVPLMELEEVELSVDEFEAIRLCDGRGLRQAKTAKQMGVSQPTLNRLLNSAHSKIAMALVEGKAIKIFGGNYTIRKR
jgi:predicted DNA-binding protein (UPF0251 family)